MTSNKKDFAFLQGSPDSSSRSTATSSPLLVNCFTNVRHYSRLKLETTATRLRLQNSREDNPSSMEFPGPQGSQPIDNPCYHQSLSDRSVITNPDDRRSDSMYLLLIYVFIWAIAVIFLLCIYYIVIYNDIISIKWPVEFYWDLWI